MNGIGTSSPGGWCPELPVTIQGTGILSLSYPVYYLAIDVTPGVFFDPTSYTVDEDAGVATLTVRTNVPGGPVDGAVQFYTEDGSATGMLLHHRGLGSTI